MKAEVTATEPCTLPPCPPYAPHPHYCRPCEWCAGSRFAQYRRCAVCKGNGRLIETVVGSVGRSPADSSEPL